uniref:Protein kinase domain-containing protein n=1 Tax=Gadus morhua TaxID=8049 RepID=A0A8C4ZCN9_GADMO
MDDQSVSVSKGDLLTTESSSYLVEDFLGEGSFGKVVRCVRTTTNEKVAVKIIKKHPKLLAAAKQELIMLRLLRFLDPDRCGIVRWMGVFKHGPHICLVFELLEQSLMDFVEQTADNTLPLMQIKHIVAQLASALYHLGTRGVIHCDLKPENVMMTGKDTQVKIIDFGLSIHVSQAKIGRDFGTLWYRSPEVMLGLPYTGMTDMWSLGCLTAELLIGDPIYPGYTEYDMWAYIIQTHGEVPDAMLEQGVKTPLCFTKESLWRLKTKREFRKSTMIKVPKKDRPRSFFYTSLEEVVESGYRPGQPIPPSFKDLLKRMLHVDCDQRITPRALLKHPFFSFPEPTMVQPCSSCPEPSVVQPHNSCTEPSVDQPCNSCPEPTVVQPCSSCTEPSVDQPHNSCPEPTVVQPCSSCPEPSVDQPNSSFSEPSVDQPHNSCPEPSVDQPNSSFSEPMMVQPCRSCTESIVDQPHSSYSEPIAVQLCSSYTEPIEVQPCNSCPEPSVDQPNSSFSEPMMVQPCRSCTESIVDQPHSSYSEPIAVQPCSSCTEPIEVQPCSSCTEPIEVQPCQSCSDPFVDQPHSSCSEPIVVQPHNSCPEPSVVQPHNSCPEPILVLPCSSCTEPIDVQPCSSFIEPMMVQPCSIFPEPTGIQLHRSCPEPTVVQLHSSCPEPAVDQPCSSFSEPIAVQPNSSCPEPTVDQPCSLPGSHTPSMSEEQREAPLDNTDRGKGTASIPTASLGVAAETVEVKPAVADIPLDFTQKKKKKQGRAKRFFKSVLGSFFCHGDQE